MIAKFVPAGLLLLACGWLGAGCQNAKPAADNSEAAGVYALASVNGNPVPCQVKHENAAMTVSSGSFTLNADGTCASLMKFSVAGHPETIREVKASYTRQGDTLNMAWERAGHTKGTLAGNTFTMNNEGMVFVYQK